MGQGTWTCGTAIDRFVAFANLALLPAVKAHKCLVTDGSCFRRGLTCSNPVYCQYTSMDDLAGFAKELWATSLAFCLECKHSRR